MVKSMIPSFNLARIPHIIFGVGKLDELYKIIPKYGKNVLFVIGGKSLKQSGVWEKITSNLGMISTSYSSISISNEPSPNLIDENTEKFRDKKLNLVVGIGGGSVIDTGKAISAMLTKNDSIENYLEGVGTKIHDGKKVPYIAIPTTSGTGSEATKNAVISKIGDEGYKKSLRHDNLIPDIAIIDPQLMISCPSSISAACGMDAFTQLLEAFVSPKGNPITDSLAYNGMKYIGENILFACTNRSSDVNVRAAMAYGSLISGIVLANAGLGIIHGLASSIGGMFEIPHGVVCGTLLAEATKINIKMLQKQKSEGKEALKKYAQIGALLEGKYQIEEGMIDQYYLRLIEKLEEWTSELKIDRLGKYEIKNEDIEKIVEKTGLKNNPIYLNKEKIKNIIINRL
ncbi:MAG: iron-containing alcohol dehydrogenase [Promethearchaeota archaeon]